MGFYMHYTGTVYCVLMTARGTKDRPSSVIYADDQGCRWARPISEFHEHVERPDCGYSGPRFRRVSQEEK